jgi:hypothetical protein
MRKDNSSNTTSSNAVKLADGWFGSFITKDISKISNDGFMISDADFNPAPFSKQFWSDPEKEGEKQSFDFLFHSNGRQRTESKSIFKLSRPVKNNIQDSKIDKSPIIQLFAQTRSSQIENELHFEVQHVFVLNKTDQTFEFPSISNQLLQQVLECHTSESNVVLANSLESLADNIQTFNLKSSISLMNNQKSAGDKINVSYENYGVQNRGIDECRTEKLETSGFINMEPQIRHISSMPKRTLEMPFKCSTVEIGNQTCLSGSRRKGKVIDIAAMKMTSLPHKLLVVDCRYFFEYIGGHVRSAVNIGSPLVLAALFTEFRESLHNSNFIDELLKIEGKEIELPDLRQAFLNAKLKDTNTTLVPGGNAYSETPVIKRNMLMMCELSTVGSSDHSQHTAKTSLPRTCVPVIVFHCEYSSNRAPSAWRLARGIDRNCNSEQYPHLDFPQMFVLKDGYEKFVASYGDCCTPAHSYVRMLAKEHKDELLSADARRNSELVILKSKKQNLQKNNF